jgi:Heparinase II/III-like protein/Heparinase II/III N-terminus
VGDRNAEFQLKRLFSFLQRLALTALTLPKLGVPSLIRVGAYRLRLRTGLLKKALPSGAAYPGPFLFERQELNEFAPHIAPLAFRRAAFSVHPINLPPRDGWHANCLSGAPIQDPRAHWTEIGDFGSGVGDIKTVWEPSRFDWLPVLAQAHTGHACTREDVLARLDYIVTDWVANNPRNIGPNWKCGQETSLRALNLILALKVSDGLLSLTAASMRFLDEHLDRVAQTLSYAIGQDNNHAISEAVALYVGGLVLTAHGGAEESVKGAAYASAGKKLLERSMLRLFLPDGTFSQYSVVYHRMALTLLCCAELFRRQFNDGGFSEGFLERAQAATRWLITLVDPVNGDAPNLGANDGTFLFNLDEAHYRDFRPSADLAAALFLGEFYFSGSKLLQLFGISVPLAVQEPLGVKVFGDGGLVAARRGSAFALLRIPRFRFRPGHADGLHLDVWHQGENVVRDGGSFSYADLHRNSFYAGTGAHSTVVFDNRDQMPRIGRFLFGRWLYSNVPPAESDSASGEDKFWGEYRDWTGACHRRDVAFTGGSLSVSDAVSGFTHQAVVNWRLCPGEWAIAGNRAESEYMIIEFESSQPFEARLTETFESRYYLQETKLPALEIAIRQPGIVTTRMLFKKSHP